MDTFCLVPKPSRRRWISATLALGLCAGGCWCGADGPPRPPRAEAKAPNDPDPRSEPGPDVEPTGATPELDFGPIPAPAGGRDTGADGDTRDDTTPIADEPTEPRNPELEDPEP